MEPVSFNPIQAQSVTPQVLREYYGLSSQLARETVLNSSEADKRILKEAVSQIPSLTKKDSESEYQQVDLKKLRELMESIKKVMEKLGVRIEIKNNSNGLFCRVMNEINGREMCTIPLHLLLQKIDTLLNEQGSLKAQENADTTLV